MVVDMSNKYKNEQKYLRMREEEERKKEMERLKQLKKEEKEFENEKKISRGCGKGRARKKYYENEIRIKQREIKKLTRGERTHKILLRHNIRKTIMAFTWIYRINC